MIPMVLVKLVILPVLNALVQITLNVLLVMKVTIYMVKLVVILVLMAIMLKKELTFVFNVTSINVKHVHTMLKIVLLVVKLITNLMETV